MASAFLSGVARSPVKYDTGADGPGPMAYASDPRLMQNNVQKPSFVGFGSTTKRQNLAKNGDMPGAGAYSIPDDFINKHIAANGLAAFKSKTDRFASIDNADEPGPGEYNLPSAISPGAKKKFHDKKQTIFEEVDINVRDGIPSIPARHQSYGYEPDRKGTLQLQKPLVPGFTGLKQDRVGPGDYDPRIDTKYKQHGVPSIGKGSERPSAEVDAKLALKNPAPGPGYYNVPSDFDTFKGGNNNASDDSNFVLRLQASRTKPSASFLSSSKRDGIFKGISVDGPGPLDYSIPSTIKVSTKPVDKQFFTSCEERFKDPLPRSMRLYTSPGSYDPRTSDFENLKLKILKQKKMASRSGWAQNIAFSGTEGRFKDTTKVEGPPPGAYRPKNEFVDMLKKSMSKGGGAFGSDTKRFEEPKPVYVSYESGFEGGHVGRDNNILESENNQTHRARFQTKPPKPTSVFASHDKRFPDSRNSDGPNPATYMTTPSWKAPGAAVMAPPTVVSKKQPDIAPGPGEYDLPSDFSMKGKVRNRKQTLGSMAPRGEKISSDGPGPGEYYSYKSILPKSHNVLLQDRY